MKQFGKELGEFGHALRGRGSRNNSGYSLSGDNGVTPCEGVGVEITASGYCAYVSESRLARAWE